MGEVSGRIPAYNVTLLVSEPEPSVQGADAAGRRTGSNGALDLKSCTAERVLVNVRAQARTVARLGRGALTSPSPVTASLPPVAPRIGLDAMGYKQPQMQALEVVVHYIRP
jgi:hypothetical protein